MSAYSILRIFIHMLPGGCTCTDKIDSAYTWPARVLFGVCAQCPRSMVCSAWRVCLDCSAQQCTASIRPLWCTVLDMLASPHAKSPGAHGTDEYTRRSHAATVTCLVPQGIPTVPSLLGDEKATNPFLRPSDPHIRAHLGFGADAPDWKVFGAIRSAKDTFRG